MKEIRADIEILSTPARVWRVFADFAPYPLWNVFLVRVAGEAKEGATLEIRVQLPGAKPRLYRAVVTRLSPGKELALRWDGLIKGEHVFTVEPMGDNMARFTQRIEFGLLAGAFVDREQADKLLEMFGHMHRALKARCEESAE